MNFKIIKYFHGFYVWACFRWHIWLKPSTSPDAGIGQGVLNLSYVFYLFLGPATPFTAVFIVVGVKAIQLVIRITFASHTQKTWCSIKLI